MQREGHSLRSSFTSLNSWIVGLGVGCVYHKPVFMSVALVIVILKFNEVMHRLMPYACEVSYFSMKTK